MYIWGGFSKKRFRTLHLLTDFLKAQKNVWKNENNVEILNWPSQSPDANPIDNTYGHAYMKFKLCGKKTRTVTNKLNQFGKYVETLAERCQAIIDNERDWTSY